MAPAGQPSGKEHANDREKPSRLSKSGARSYHDEIKIKIKIKIKNTREIHPKPYGQVLIRVDKFKK